MNRPVGGRMLMGSRSSKPQRRSRQAAVVNQPRMQQTFAAALRCGGDVAAMLALLSLPSRTLAHRLSILRKAGAARTVTLFDPAARGLSIECVTLVRLKRHDQAHLDAFEAWCLSEIAVTSAARICGRHDYQLTTFHRTFREADDWRYRISTKPEVGSISQRLVKTVHGHGIAGLLLRK